MITRGEIVDLLVRDGESLVLTKSQCLRLTQAPTAVLGLLAQPRSTAEIETHLTSLFGSPPEGRLEEILAEMAEQGLVKF